MAFPSKNYAPPGVYTQTRFENPLQSAFASVKIPVLIGEGNEELLQSNLEIVRGSSSVVDQRVVDEDCTGRAVVSINKHGVVTLGDFDGVLDRIHVRNFPIVSGDGTGTPTNNRTDVTVTVNGVPVVVRSVVGTTGVVQLAQAPNPGDVVRVTYFFDRTDTQFTDDVSAQVPNTLATVRGYGGLYAGETVNLHGDVVVGGVVTTPANNVLRFRVDGVVRAITLPPRPDYQMDEVALAITAAKAGTLTATVFENNAGATVLMLTAASSLEVLSGSANGPLFLTTGSADKRVSTFCVFQRPIVDGSGGGITTTDPSHVTVRVNGKQVIPTAVDGASGAVTLPVAPPAGSKVSITYYWNTWQDTFDYVNHIGVDRVVRCGMVPGGSDYIQGADFVLQNDRIMWGTAATVEAGVTTEGATLFGEAQVGLTLVDNRNFLGECAPVVRSSGEVAAESRTEFVLPFQPTLGNGRDTPLGQSLHQSISNGRLDLPVDRPDVIWAYWGWDAQDAFARGRVEVVRVEGLTITLAEPVPVGAKVYATQYYNSIQDQTYTVASKSAGGSGVGTYEVADAQGEALFAAQLDGKGAALTGIALEFPSGTEMTPDFRFESGSGDSFTGPVDDEVVTVTFASRPAGPARFTFPGAAPYYTVAGLSDHLRVRVRGSEAPLGGAGINLQTPAVGGTHWGLAHLVGEEIVYTGGAGATVGESFTTTATEQFALRVDGTDVVVTVPPMTGEDASFIAECINEAAHGHKGLAQAGSGASTIVLDSAAMPLDDYYVGYKVVLGYDSGVGMVGGGQVRTVTAYDGTTKEATLDAGWDGGAPPPVGQPYYIYNPATRSALVGATRFDGPVEIASGKFDKITFRYQGASSGAYSEVTATLTAGVYNSPAALAAEVETQMNAALAALIVGPPGVDNLLGVAVECSANVDGQLEFRLQLAGRDGAGFLRFHNASTPAEDFCILAGLPAGDSSLTAQAALVQGPIARAYEVPASGATKRHDRIILRSRVLAPANGGLLPALVWAAQSKVEVVTGYEKAGLIAGKVGTVNSPVVVPAKLAFNISLQNGQDATSYWPGVTFYDGTGTLPANNVLQLNLSGVPVTVTFTASGAGTFTPFGPATSSGTVAYQIEQAILAALTQAGQAGAYTLSLVGATSLHLLSTGKGTLDSRISVGNGSANKVFGLSQGTNYPVGVQAEDIASALMSHAQTSLGAWLMSLTSFSTNTFAGLALAGVVSDSTGAKHLYIQDAPTNTPDLGAASSLVVKDAPARNALAYGTGLDAVDGDGGVGNPAVEGFYVTSSNPTGSGSANTSVLNDGVGQDGLVGQTYRDAVTGLTFTVLPRGFRANPTGPWVAYPTGANANFRIKVSREFVCNANIPTLAVPGVEMLVTNTVGVEAGDTALVKTFARSGNEPAIGDLYYVSYVYRKQDYSTGFFTKLSAVESAFGSAIPDNPLSLAANLAVLNGAVLVGLKQVRKESGSHQASLTSYRSAIDELEGVLPGGSTPDIVVPLRGDSLDLYQYLKRSNDKMSSRRYKSERTSIVGMAAGLLPKDAVQWAQALNNTRMRLVYPDTATITVQDSEGSTKEYLVDGTFVAAALAGSVVSPNYDVATPWTGRQLVGFTQLARRLDSVTMNQIAQAGVNIVEHKGAFLRVRHGLTTDMSSKLMRQPEVILIADEVQRQARDVLDVFIGVKFLPGVRSQIEGRLSMMLKSLVAAQIITAYTGVKASVNPDDPTVASVVAYYCPVFGLNYIEVEFHMRSSL